MELVTLKRDERCKTTVYLREETKTALKAIAAVKRSTMQDVINALVERAVTEHIMGPK